MQQWINYRVRVTIQDSRMLVGTLTAFDRHMNIVLSDCEEFRRVKAKGADDEKELKRGLGFVLLRGENIISMTAEAPPPAESRKMGEGPMGGPGRGLPGGRGVPVAPLGAAPAGLAGPIRGIGGAAPAQMMPQRPGGPPLPSQGGMMVPGAAMMQRPGMMPMMPPPSMMRLPMGMPPPGMMAPQSFPPTGTGQPAGRAGRSGGPAQ